MRRGVIAEAEPAPGHLLGLPMVQVEAFRRIRRTQAPTQIRNKAADDAGVVPLDDRPDEAARRAEAGDSEAARDESPGGDAVPAEEPVQLVDPDRGPIGEAVGHEVACGRDVPGREQGHRVPVDRPEAVIERDGHRALGDRALTECLHRDDLIIPQQELELGREPRGPGIDRQPADEIALHLLACVIHQDANAPAVEPDQRGGQSRVIDRDPRADQHRLNQGLDEPSHFRADPHAEPGVSGVAPTRIPARLSPEIEASWNLKYD